METKMGTKQQPDRDRVFLRLFLKSSPSDVTDEEVAYFRDHPNEIEEVTAPVNVHKLFLWAGALFGIMFVGLSKVLNYSGIQGFMSKGFFEFVIDILSGVGTELIGAAVTAYLLGILLNKQQDNASKWRAEIRRRIGKERS
jgi:hypothetical protein